ncbi:hypothetical protein N2599_26370 (plasmid) [Rhizobium sullae]|uniref:Transmembrane protein n=1 Tax=Rhizobium sullae TaxID=50338 RepID=A0A2N0DB14_RHISU|nr:hypothetical protein [Rhizobium sullae]PKA43293.1 hypothetical protein CWR43_09905 [Rhizobium sullae]UWU18719.1 hypothetical protein N2599_26370 [Rhizobium sullae]
MIPGATLSRWTMSYFAAALLFLLLAEGMLAAGLWKPSADIGDPITLIIVHCVTIGWFGLLMIGALLQFAPVLTGAGLVTERLNLPALVAIVAGLAALICGFAAIKTGSPTVAVTMPVAAALLAVGLIGIGAVLFTGLWCGRSAHSAASFVLLGILCLAVTVVLGVGFALVLSGATDVPLLVDLSLRTVPLHAGFGLGGWMSLAAIGVSYKLMSMFLLSPDTSRTRVVLAGGACTFLTLAVALFCLFTHRDVIEPLLFISAVVFLGTIAVYATEMRILYRARRRKTLELNSIGSIPAFVLLALSMAALVVSIPLHADDRTRAAIVYLFAFGWLTGLGLAQLLKIVPFLTWLEAFGPLLGRRPTPRLQDLIKERRASFWLAGFYLAVVSAAASIAANTNAGFQISAFAQLICSAGLIFELFQVRILANVGAIAKSSPFHQPGLLIAKINSER